MKTPLVSQSSAGAAVWIWGRGPEGVLGRIHVLATAETGEDLSGAMTDTA